MAANGDYRVLVLTSDAATIDEVTEIARQSSRMRTHSLPCRSRHASRARWRLPPRSISVRAAVKAPAGRNRARAFPLLLLPRDRAVSGR
jgi:hypothetical protein